MWKLDKYTKNTAVIDETGKIYSYATLSTECDTMIQHIKSTRCLVFQLCRNQIGALIGYIAFLNHRIVPLLLDSQLDNGLLFNLIDLYKPDYLWIPSDMAGEFPGYKAVYTSNQYTLVQTTFIHAFPLHDELALLLTTSGSTGSPKLVRQSYQNIKTNMESIASYLELTETERPITTMPMSYTYGLSIINSHLHAGASIILTQKTMMQKEFWQQCREYKATSFGGVPYIYEMLNKLRFFGMQLPDLRTMTQAGGKLSPELHKRFAEYAQQNGKRFIVMYGQTEATARMSYLPSGKSLEKYGSMGIAIPGGRLSLLDENGHEINEPDTVGELVYEGANVTLGYAEKGADLIKGDERNGRLVTGDMARRDKEGYYYIAGRKKRFLKIFGSRINLDETEQMVKTGFPDADCACTGRDDRMVVYLNSPQWVQDVHKFLAEKTGLNPVAFQVKAIDAIPKNEAGKTLYTVLEGYDDTK